jgi:SEL1 protein
LGKNTPRAKVNIPELEFGGVYGESVSGPGNPKVQKESSGSSLSTRDVLEYYSLQADGGDKTAQILLAQMYYMGSLKIPVDYAKARRYALLAYKQKPIDDDQKSEKKKDDKYTVSGSAADLLGKMYWRGEGVERNDVTARRWFEKGASVNNPDCIYSLGLMYEQGLAGLPKVF